MKKMYSPLRYPGGKLKIYNRVVKLMENNDLINCWYVEPFAGGFGIGIRLLFEGKVQGVIYNDLDSHLYNFWFSVLNYTDELCDRIEKVNITIEERNRQRNIYKNPSSDVLSDGFATLFLNRVNYSGVIKGGPIGGNHQSGKYLLDCRFRRDDLISTIRRIAQYKKSIKLYNLDAIEFMKRVLRYKSKKFFINIDPPYVVKGPLLYQQFYKGNHPHIELSEFMKTRMKFISWMMTYDDADLIREIYKEYKLIEYDLVHNAGGSKNGKEILITNLEALEW